jgi:hypothetical protein
MQKKELFGEIAIRLNLATLQQVKLALKKQRQMAKQNRHRLIGLIMLDMNIFDTTGLIDILKEIDKSV